MRTGFFLSSAWGITTTTSSRHEELMGMASRTSGAYVGSAALKIERPTQLRLVHNRLATNNDVHTEQRRTPRALKNSAASAESPVLLFACTAIMLVIMMCSLALDDLRYARSELILDSAATQTVHVSPNDTLWSIAIACGGGSDVSVSEVVSWIRSTNELRSSALSVGQSLQVPIL